MQPGTWQNIGLGVAVSFAAFGLSGIAAPQYAVREAFGLEPEIRSAADVKTNTKTDTASPSPATLITPLIGVRDLVIASTLAMLWKRGLGWEMGFVIVSRTILCSADTLLIAKQKGLHEGLMASTGLVAWLIVGAGLITSGSE